MDEWPRASPARERASSYRVGVSVGDVRAETGFAVGQICPERYRRRLETGLKIKRTPYREAETTYISALSTVLTLGDHFSAGQPIAMFCAAVCC
jgi:hypothetical protein